MKQIGRRVQGTENFWSEAGSEKMLQLRADYLLAGQSGLADLIDRHRHLLKRH